MSERYGIRYSDSIKDRIRNTIWEGNAKKVGSQSNRVHIYDVTIPIKEHEFEELTAKAKPVTIRCVYDRERRTVATVLDSRHGRMDQGRGQT